MSGYVEIRTKGLTELTRELGNLAAEVRMAGGNKVTQAGARTIARRARKLVPVRTGTLKRSLHVLPVSKKGSQKITYYVTHKTGTKYKDDGWYAHVVEYGTKPHTILGKIIQGTDKRRPMGNDARFGVRAEHPGASAKPYMRPAFEQMSDKAIEDMANRLDKFIATGK